ncbi:hypothetical protein A3K62_01860 [Candidatus Pacearchaeota archaeon RBG_16_35_8]|nr:MAG: hypothetical protein A3K62_01860 [Candidatus Pacearchaeota archaeon RBG_16_35_8]
MARLEKDGKDAVKKWWNLSRYTEQTQHRIILSFLTAVILVFLFIFIWNFFSDKLDEKEGVPTCGDGSFYDTCNLNKPYYCDAEAGKLVEKATLCGCPEGMVKSGETCISHYQIGAKEIALNYTLRGESNNISFKVYENMASYLSGLPKSIYYDGSQRLLRSDFKLRDINNQEQKKLLIPLLVAIENAAETKEDRVRIAISLVQNIEFGNSNRTLNLPGNNGLTYSRYPYEVLYDQMGVCGEKSELLAFLLKEMGYGVVFFYYQEENHEALGIKCSIRYSVDETGYCFIETTGPSIMTDTRIEYSGGIKLRSKPEVILVSNGDMIGPDMYEYKDAKEIMKLRDSWFSLFKKARLNGLKEKYGLVETYNPQ